MKLNKIKAGDYTILHHDQNQTWLDIKKVEELKNAKYIGEFSLKTLNGQWSNFPVSVFYTKEKHPQGSHYFGLYHNPLTGNLTVCDANIITRQKYAGVLNKDTKEILYSAFRHDYQSYGDMMVDGGHDNGYIRTSGHPLVKFVVKKDKIVVDNKLE